MFQQSMIPFNTLRNLTILFVLRGQLTPSPKSKVARESSHKEKITGSKQRLESSSYNIALWGEGWGVDWENCS